ncbi:septum formation protein Maf [Candidatus Bathyarchaeota archaeon]|nr:septum formation protein Maf [Candidatus Bathyarchaeota archaeon]MBT7186554.1 septum formation protein Maf [Candidatus Bathyarchaeota archaeon]MBT7914205.1 septum formation protein Maf [Candidatus Bathyarchaeota archaeon]
MVCELKILLASSSPRRLDLIRELGWDFKVANPTVVEDEESMNPVERVEVNALRKARSIEGCQGYLIIGADTVVFHEGEILGKPGESGKAAMMLRKLSGKPHKVYTGVTILNSDTGEMLTRHEETTVWFKELDDETIETYVATGEPLDKAGAYGIQGEAGALVDRIEGSYSNVVGLPLELVREMLNKICEHKPANKKYPGII